MLWNSRLRLQSKGLLAAIFGSVFVLMGVGVVRAFTRGGYDFNVFYQAWRLVLEGRGSEIYRVSPDRFLYGPGFAWLLCPLGIFSKESALGIWCMAKAGVLIFVVKKLSHLWRGSDSIGSVGWGALGLLLVSKPVLIDFEYGQVNLFILGACVWGLVGHFEKDSSPIWDRLRWCVLTFAALAKLFPMPLLLVPWVVTSGISSGKLKFERQAIFIGGAIALFLPLLSQGWDGTWYLFSEWHRALLSRGFPLESHNQSFPALLYHYLSGNATAVLSEGVHPLFFGKPWLSPAHITLLSLFWTALTLGITLGWVVSGSNHSPVKWIPVLIGLLIIPSHLIWKPYFVMSLPLAIWIVHQCILENKWRSWFILAVLFIGINLTGFDFVGHSWAAHFEAASLLLLIHLFMMAMVLRYSSNNAISMPMSP